MNRFLFGLFTLVQLSAVVAFTPAEQLEIRDVNGRTVRPLSSGDARATVFVFTRADCPISNRYAPEVRRLHEEFARRGIAFWLVYPGRNVSPASIKAHLSEYSYTLPAVQDPDLTLVKLTGVRVTPEVAVFAGTGDQARLVYHGRIDNRFEDFGKARQAASQHELVEALQAILAGKPVKTPTAPAVGCFISDLE